MTSENAEISNEAHESVDSAQAKGNDQQHDNNHTGGNGYRNNDNHRGGNYHAKNGNHFGGNLGKDNRSGNCKKRRSFSLILSCTKVKSSWDSGTKGGYGQNKVVGFRKSVFHDFSKSE